jgi:benzoate-CoA ligase family protein
LVNLPETFNAATYFVDRNVSEGRGQRVAIESGEEKVTYSQLLERTNRAGNGLKALGVRPEERVQLLLLDSPEFLYSFFGAIKIGAVAVPTSTLLKAADYEYIFNDTRARVAIVSQPLLPILRDMPPGRLRYLKIILVAHGDQGGDMPLRQLMDAASPELEAEHTSRDDAAFWLYSSGSTGFPKGCIHLQHDMVVCTEAYARGILRANENDRSYSVARLFFAYGLGNAGYFPLGCGGTTILSPERPTAPLIYDIIERYRPTLFYSVPTNYSAILAHRRENGPDFDLSSVRHAISAGEALPAALYERFKSRFGIEILDALGSTESLHMVISNRPGEAKAGSSGKIIPGYEARIVDDAGRDVPQGEMGNLLVKTDALCAGYWNQHERTKSVFEGHWFRTGDKYYQDEDGYFWCAGRSDDLFKVSGSWLSPTEVESQLITHPAVQEAAVIAREDEERLLRPVAYVVVNSDFRPSDELARELQEWVGQRLAGYKRPRWVEFLNELPKTPTGKLQRFKLREMQSRPQRRSS